MIAAEVGRKELETARLQVAFCGALTQRPPTQVFWLWRYEPGFETGQGIHPDITKPSAGRARNQKMAGERVGRVTATLCPQ